MNSQHPFSTQPVPTRGEMNHCNQGLKCSGKKETKVEFVNIMLHIYLTRQGGVALTLFIYQANISAPAHHFPKKEFYTLVR